MSDLPEPFSTNQGQQAAHVALAGIFNQLLGRPRNHDLRTDFLEKLVNAYTVANDALVAGSPLEVRWGLGTTVMLHESALREYTKVITHFLDVFRHDSDEPILEALLGDDEPS